MLHSLWAGLSVLTLVVGILVILAPRFVVTVNSQLSKALGSVDDLIMRYRHLVGAILLVVAYLCFRLALLIPTGSL
jgi:uncharacterized membrane protein